MSAAERLAEQLEPLERAVLEPGETLRGSLAATEAKTFGGGVRAVIVTDRRIVVQPVDRKWNAKGDPLSIRPEDVADFRVSGLGDSWWNTAISLVSHAGFELRLRTAAGRKLKLMAMSGEGMLLGRMSGEETQRAGATALLGWLRQLDELDQDAAGVDPPDL